MKFLILLVSVLSALNISQNEKKELIRRKRDLIGWNRVQNTVNQFVRHKTAGDDEKTFTQQYKQIIMELHKSKQDLGKELKKAIKMIRKRRKGKNLRHS